MPQARSSEKTFSAAVDSISEGIAVLETPAGPLRIPASLLPEGATEGMRLTVSMALDPDGTERVRSEIRALRQELTGGDPGPDVTEI